MRCVTQPRLRCRPRSRKASAPTERGVAHSGEEWCFPAPEKGNRPKGEGNFIQGLFYSLRSAKEALFSTSFLHPRKG
jgi:hypothetical protein